MIKGHMMMLADTKTIATVLKVTPPTAPTPQKQETATAAQSELAFDNAYLTA